MKVAVIGATGQLGMVVAAEFARNGDQVCRFSHAQIEIFSLSYTRKVLLEAKPSLIVNTAAMHRVESCEQEPSAAYAINAIGARNLALVAQDLGAALLHISTDYVFDGLKRAPYLESDAAVPLNVYGNTKLAGELFVQSSTNKYFILRTSALYGKNPCRAKGGLNFVDLMLKLAAERDELRVVNDEVVSPTSTAELAKQMVVLSRTESYGVYHATAEGSCSWFEFASKILEIADVRTNLVVAGVNEFPAKVQRPQYSVLENYGLKQLGLNSFGSWEDGLRCYLASTHLTDHERVSTAS